MMRCEKPVERIKIDEELKDDSIKYVIAGIILGIITACICVGMYYGWIF